MECFNNIDATKINNNDMILKRSYFYLLCFFKKNILKLIKSLSSNEASSFDDICIKTTFVLKSHLLRKTY